MTTQQATRTKNNSPSSVNGCGVHVWRWYIAAPYARLFNNVCCLHDELYTVGGSKAERKKADRLLFKGMAKLALKQYGGRPLKVWWLVSVTLFYYCMVRVFGQWYWNKIS